MKEFLQTRRMFVVIVALGLFTLAARGATDPDMWWHLRTGQLILQNHHLLHTDPFSFTNLGRPWINHEWLSDILIFICYRVAGWGGLIVAFGAIVAAALMLMFARCPGGPYVAGIMTLWGAFASAPSWGVRPQMFSFLLASAFLLILERSDGRPRLLWWTPVLTLLWVNLHAGYALGIGLMILFLAGDGLNAMRGLEPWTQSASRLRRLALVTVVCVAVVPVNPNGFRMYVYPLQTLHSSAMQNYIAEWASPNFHEHKYFPLLALLLVTMILTAISPRRLRPRDLLLLAVLTFAALLSVRHVPIYVLIAVPLLSGLLDDWLRESGAAPSLRAGQAPLPAGKALLNLALLACFLIFMTVRVRHTITHQAQAERTAFPAGAATFISQQRPPGPILNHYNWGGYFIWRLYPEYPVYIDGRADLYGDSFMDQFAATYYLRGGKWQDPLQRFGIQTVILPPDAPLVSALRAMPGWKAVWADKQAVVLTRTQGP